MGGHKKDIPWDSINEGCSESLDWAPPDEAELTEDQLFGLQIQTLLKEVEDHRDVLKGKLDRMKYYRESVTQEDIERWLTEMDRIIKEFS